MSYCGPNPRNGKPRPMQTGADGASAYDIWKAHQPCGADTSLDAYLASMVGCDGQSAYDLWLAQGNVGTEEQYMASLKGKPGEKGEPGARFFSTSVIPDTRWMSNIGGHQAYANGDNVDSRVTYYKTRVVLENVPDDYVGKPLINVHLNVVPLLERYPANVSIIYDYVPNTPDPLEDPASLPTAKNVLVIVLSITDFDSYMDLDSNDITVKPEMFAPEIFVEYMTNKQ